MNLKGYKELHELTVQEMAAVFDGASTGWDMPAMFQECLRRLQEHEQLRLAKPPNWEDVADLIERVGRIEQQLSAKE